ncbi:helix-turn-helix domain-containing protein [Bacteroidota bacterium]
MFYNTLKKFSIIQWMMKGDEFKYNLKERLEALPHQDYHDALVYIPQSLNITQRTFSRYLNTRITESYSMPADHLARLAKFFNCRIEALLNYDPLPLSFNTVCNSDSMQIAKKLKMVK